MVNLVNMRSLLVLALTQIDYFILLFPEQEAHPAMRKGQYIDAYVTRD
jgi:hypothetical protein